MEVIHSEKVMTVVRRALNLIDSRLVDHGVKVMSVLQDMLKAEDCQDALLQKNLSILAMLHDVGAYRTEEIDNLVQFETGSVWEHSIYGYLFLREFTPLKEWAEVVLYHHAGCGSMEEVSGEIRHYAQMLHIADRAVVWHDEGKRPEEELKKLFSYGRGTAFSPESIDLFWRACRQMGTLEQMDRPVCLERRLNCSLISPQEARSYLAMVVHAIDFRSHVTVTHTMSVMEIGLRLARRMGLPVETQEQIYYGALLHDLGKIGTPVSILEKPGRLTAEEMAIMREHVVLSGQIIEGCVEQTVARIALRHHEKLDGSGYPLGLSGEELSLPERLLAVADMISALCMSRSYKEAYSKERCLMILWELCDKGQLDSQVVKTADTFFDEILAETDKACEPLRRTYDRISTEYQVILKQHRGSKEMPDGQKAGKSLGQEGK